VPLHRLRHLPFVAVIGREEVGAHQQQNDVVGLDMPVDFFRKILTGTDPSVVPDLDDPLPLEQRKLLFDLVPQRLVGMRIREKHTRQCDAPQSNWS
jgi:hypothetical protein